MLPALLPSLLPVLLLGVAPALAGPLAQPAGHASVALRWEEALVPPRWTTPRDRLTVAAVAAWRPDPRAGVDLRVDGLRRDQYADGVVTTGPGDIRLGVEGVVFDALLRGSLRAETKLPNADDRVELGTDETDLALLADLRRPGDRAEVGLRGGVVALGDPHRVGARVWVPRLGADVAAAAGPLAVVAATRVDLPAAAGSAPDEPARALAELGARLPCPVRLEARAALGLTAAAPRWQTTLSVGWQAGCGTAPVPAVD